MARTTPNASQTRSSKRLAVKLVALSTIAFLVVQAIRIGFSALPAGAYPVVSTVRWAGSWTRPRMVDDCDPHYTWLSNGDLAYLQTNAKGTPQVCYQKMDARGPVGRVRYGPELPPGLSMYTFVPSPDEKWVAYRQFSNAGEHRTVVISADGKITRTVPASIVAWLPNSRGFLATPNTGDASLQVDLLDSPPKTHSVMRASGTPVAVSYVPVGPKFVVGKDIYHPDTFTSHNYPRMVLHSYSASNLDVATGTWEATVPAQAQWGSAAASPDGKHLLWSVYREHRSSWWPWLRNRLPDRRSVSALRSPPVQLFFLSDVQGHDMHRLFEHMEFMFDNMAPRWTPDGKHLSFLYKNQLYLLPVD